MFDTVMEANKKFVKACAFGNLSQVQFYLTEPRLTNNANINYKEDLGLINAAANGHLVLVKYLLTSPELTKHSKIQSQKYGALTVSCRYGHLEVAEYLTTSPELKKLSKISADALITAAEGNHWHIVKFLLTDDRLKNPANAHGNNDQVFKQACNSNNVEMIDFLLHKIPNPINIANNYYQAVTWACEHREVLMYIAEEFPPNYDFYDIMLPGFIRSITKRRFDILETMIFDLNFRYDTTVQEHLNTVVEQGVAKQIEKMFSNRELNRQLDNKLVNKPSEIINRKKI